MTQLDSVNIFHANLALVLAFSSTYESSLEGAEGCFYLNGNDPKAPSTNESTAAMLQAYTQYFPGLIAATNQQLAPTAQAQLGAQQATGDASQKLALDLYSKYGPQFSQIGNQIDSQNKLASSNSDLAVLQGPGAQLAQTAQDIRAKVNPEEVAAQKAIQGQIGSLVSGLDPTKLSGSESAQVERSLGRDNAKGGALAGGINTVGNAMSFGNALGAKQSNISSILNNSAGALGASSNRFDPIATALGRPSTEAGTSQFTGVNPTAGDQAFNLGQGFLGNISQTNQQQNQINSERRNGLDRLTDFNSSISL